MRYYPVFLDLQGKSAIVIGGGVVAERKVQGLLACGAAVTVISPELTASMAKLAQRGAIRVEQRTYRRGDLAGAFLAVVGTDDPEVNHQAAEEARAAKVLVNTVDDVAYCDFIAPAVVQQGDITLAISTNGKSPAMARFLREALEQYLTPEYADLLQVLERVRQRLRTERAQVDAEQWQQQIDDDLRETVRQGRLQDAEDLLYRRLLTQSPQGASA